MYIRETKLTMGGGHMKNVKYERLNNAGEGVVYKIICKRSPEVYLGETKFTIGRGSIERYKIYKVEQWTHQTCRQNGASD